MKVCLLVRVEPSRSMPEAEAMLRGAHESAERESGTVAWFAFRENATAFGVFDAFECVG